MSSQTARLPQEGEKLGSGVLLSLLSTGGSAYVYKTWCETMEIHRAVKVMSPDAEPDIRDRFSTEARINSKLIHPNIVHCYNFGTTLGGLPFLEMEYIAGPSLASLITKRGALPLSVALAVAQGILEGLAYAHAVKYTLYDKQHVGIIHRDIKPANVIISNDGLPKLMDFGIARPVDFSIHTVAGTVPGTVAYMSPEACAGGDLDFRSDTYQFGLCLYEMLSGVAAYPQTDLTSLLSAKSAGKVQPLESLTRNLPSAVLAFVSKCLARDPALRFESAQACLNTLRPLLVSVAGTVPPESILQAHLEGREPLAQKAGEGLRRSTLVRAFAVAALISVVVGGAFWLSGHRGSTSIAPLSVPPPTSIASANPSPALFTPVSPVSRGVSPSPVSRRAKTAPHDLPKADSSVVPPQNSAPIPEDAALSAIKEGRGLFSQGRVSDALACFQKALRLPSAQPHKEIVRQCVYESAKCNTALFKQGQVPRSNYTASWQTVLNTYPVEAPESVEAAAHLKEAN
ncbi:MAG: protein kinase [Fibrobacterota bacterium]